MTAYQRKKRLRLIREYTDAAVRQSWAGQELAADAREIERAFRDARRALFTYVGKVSVGAAPPVAADARLEARTKNLESALDACRQLEGRFYAAFDARLKALENATPPKPAAKPLPTFPSNPNPMRGY